MKNHSNGNGNSKTNGFVPSSFKFISSCIKTASSGVRSAGASVAASISGDGRGHKDQVLWVCFDWLELGPSSFKHVLLLGYTNGFQVLDIEDASNVRELVSKHDDPVSFLQMQPVPGESQGCKGFRASHPLLLVVACDKLKIPGTLQNGRDGHTEAQAENIIGSATAVRFYSLRSHTYVHALRFRSTVYMVRCSPQIVAVGLATQIYCFDALTLENKFSVLTYPVPQLGGQGMVGVNIGYGPMAVGPRWLAYASNNPLLSNTGRLSPRSLTPPTVSPSTSPSGGNLVARYAMESSKHLAAGLINLSDIGYRTLSKYYQDLIPDGSSSPPLSSNSSWKVNRFTSHSAETDTAGTVVVKDFVSRIVVAQFRAHTSPISALCFDPSGTLLVTASIHGNNINIFRIMPTCSRNGSGSESNDWGCSHAHLYKLHRGMTSAVIQDICFSHYSQWVAIISSKGTCHIFVLAPFGGETVLQIRNQETEGPVLLPILSQPWWFTPHFTVNQQQFLAPPPPVVLSVVSRIKNNNAGWLNTVSNAESSAAGKVHIPSGAVSAVFHNSVPHDVHNANSKAHVMEHLLVYTPSGHLIQYKLLPSLVAEPRETAPRMAPVPSERIQEEDLRLKVEPVQWWDVCRIYDWPEREVPILGNNLGEPEAAEMILGTSVSEDNSVDNNNSIKLHEQCHFSNAEVQISSGRIPIWQKSEVSLFLMSPLEAREMTLWELSTGGEIEIENIPVDVVEIRQNDLLPVLNHFHRIHSTWGDSVLVGRCSGSSSDSHGAEENLSEDAVISHTKLMIPNSAEKADVGASHFADCITTAVKSSKHDTASNCDSLDTDQFFQEGYCKASVDCHESTEVATDVDCSSPCGREKSDEDGVDDDMLGDVFDFSE